MNQQVQILTEDQAAAIWSGGDTASLLNKTDTPEPEKKVETTTTEDPEKKVILAVPPTQDLDLDNVFAEAPDEDEDEDEQEQEDDKETDKKKEPDTKTDKPVKEESKKGRKPEVVSLVNKLITEGDLLGFDDAEEVRTVEEAEELIKSNIKHIKESVEEESWKDRVKTKYSPQVQTIIHFAEQGAQSAEDLINLLGAIKDVEDINELDPNTVDGQKEIIRQSFLSKGFKEQFAEEQVALYSDLGEERLKKQAESLYPDLQKLHQDNVAKQIQERELRNKHAEEGKRKYLTTIKETLDKDVVGSVPLQREDKYKIMDALAVQKFTSLNGQPTNGFIKTLEDLQFGDKKDYDLFLNIVHHAIDPKGFLEKVTSKAKTETTRENVRQIKAAKKVTPNSEQDKDTGPKTRTIKKTEFKNPFE